VPLCFVAADKVFFLIAAIAPTRPTTIQSIRQMAARGKLKFPL
jgi:hypothetical protein